MQNMENKVSDTQKKMASAVYCVVFCNGIANNYALEVVDYIQEYEHKFSKGVYKALSLLEKQIDKSGSVMRSRVNDESTYNFFFDLSNNSYKEVETDISKFEISVKNVLDKHKLHYSDIAAKVECLNTLTDYAVKIVNQVISEFEKDCDTDFLPRKTFVPLRIDDIDVLVKRLHGMLCSSKDKINLNDDMNCRNGYSAINNKLMSSDFYKGIFKQTDDMEKGISKEQREEIEEQDTLKKLKEHFNCK